MGIDKNMPIITDNEKFLSYLPLIILTYFYEC